MNPSILTKEEALTIKADRLTYRRRVNDLGVAWKRQHPGTTGTDNAVGVVLIAEAERVLGEPIRGPRAASSFYKSPVPGSVTLVTSTGTHQVG